MSQFTFQTVDVFTDRMFGGNPLAVFAEASGLRADQMQSLAAELNLSETVFILPPEGVDNTARLRIFNRTAEMAFAGHPTIGAAYVLARNGRASSGKLTLEVPAGLVSVTILLNGSSQPIGAAIEAPQPLSIGEVVSPALVAACLGIETTDIIVTSHEPVVVSVGNPYVIAEVSMETLTRCQPNIAMFRVALAKHPSMGGRFSLHVYARQFERIRARMFAPLAGTWEDPATGSANGPLVAYLLSLTKRDSFRLEIQQGVEMGRPSLLVVEARKMFDGIRASVAGQCVDVFRGSIDVGADHDTSGRSSQASAGVFRS